MKDLKSMKREFYELSNRFIGCVIEVRPVRKLKDGLKSFVLSIFNGLHTTIPKNRVFFKFVL